MIPASHLLAGFVAGRLTRELCAPASPRVKAWRDPLVVAAVTASCFPDWDVLPGLVAGYEGAQFHRGATHSPVGVLLQALSLTPVGQALWRRLRNTFPRLQLAPPPGAGRLFSALAAAMGLHALADALNPWGIAPWWPASRDGATWNLVHEGDLAFLALAALAATIAVRGSARGIAVSSVLAAALFVGWKASRRGEAREIASERLGPDAAVYPTPAADCPWVAMANQDGALRAACVEPGGGLRVVRNVVSAASPRVEASKSHPAVADFLEDRRFAFAEEEQDAAGNALVLWRDLRESLLEGDGDPRFGLAVEFDAEGRVASVEHRWLLKIAF